MAPRIAAISPVAPAAPAWGAVRGQPQITVTVPAAPAPAAPAEPAGAPGPLASMAPALLPPGFGTPATAAAAAAVGQQILQQARNAMAGAGLSAAPTPKDTTPAPLAAALPPPEALLLRSGAAAPAAALAAAWRAQVLGGAPARRLPAAAGLPGLPGSATAAGWSAMEFPLLAALPAGLATSAAQPGAVPAALSAMVPTWVPDRAGWLLQAWDGRGVALRLFEPEAEDPPATGAARGLPALRLAVELPRLGRIVVQLQLAAGGVWLAMAVEDETSIPWVQAALPALTQALGQAGLRLLRWRLERGSGHGSAFANLPLHLPPSATMLAPALFRAAAEVVLVLQAVDAAVAGHHGTEVD